MEILMVLAMRLRLSGDRSPRALGADPCVLGSRARDPKRSSSGSEVTTTRVSPGVPSMKSDAPPSPMDGDIKVEDREVRAVVWS